MNKFLLSHSNVIVWLNQEDAGGCKKISRREIFFGSELEQNTKSVKGLRLSDINCLICNLFS